MMAMTTIVAFAQKLTYTTIATCSRDMQTQVYGKVRPLSITIERDGNSSVTIDGSRYAILRTDRRTDTDSVQSVQYTLADTAGKEYVIKFFHDIYNKVELMRWQIIFMETAKPYDWTYYFTNQPKEKQAAAHE